MLGIEGGECGCGFKSNARIRARDEDFLASKAGYELCNPNPLFLKKGEWISLHGLDLDKVLVGKDSCDKATGLPATKVKQDICTYVLI